MVAYLQEMYVCVLGGLSVGNVRGNAGSPRTHTTRILWVTACDQLTQCSEVARQQKPVK